MGHGAEWYLSRRFQETTSLTYAVIGSERKMKHPSVSKDVAEFFAEDSEMRHTAVLFRNRVYVACPRHLDAIRLAFAGMTEIQKHRVSNRIADGKETMLFGSAYGDGGGWEHQGEFQNARMIMYGFD